MYILLNKLIIANSLKFSNQNYKLLLIMWKGILFDLLMSSSNDYKNYPACYWHVGGLSEKQGSEKVVESKTKFYVW